MPSLSINITPVADVKYGDGPHFVINFVDHSVISYS
jgi:hypothetical protein